MDVHEIPRRTVLKEKKKVVFFSDTSSSGGLIWRGYTLFIFIFILFPNLFLAYFNSFLFLLVLVLFSGAPVEEE